jgi:hypothetical protein
MKLRMSGLVPVLLLGGIPLRQIPLNVYRLLPHVSRCFSYVILVVICSFNSLLLDIGPWRGSVRMVCSSAGDPMMRVASSSCDGKATIATIIVDR